MNSTQPIPMIGTPAQNAFAFKLAAVAVVDLPNEINSALGQPMGTALTQPLDVATASRVIEHLLPLAEAKGFKPSKKRKGKRSFRRPSIAASPASTVSTAPNASQAAEYGADAFEIVTRADTKILCEVLEGRGFPARLAVESPDMVGGALAVLRASARAVKAWESGDVGTAAEIAILRAAITDTGMDLEEMAQ